MDEWLLVHCSNGNPELHLVNNEIQLTLKRGLLPCSERIRSVSNLSQKVIE